MDLTETHLESIREASNVNFDKARGDFVSFILGSTNLEKVTISFSDLRKHFPRCHLTSMEIHITYESSKELSRDRQDLHERIRLVN